MKNKIYTFLIISALVVSILPSALADNNTPHALETPYETSEYMDVTKDSKGRTTEFTLDFERGIQKLSNKDIEPVYGFQSDISATNPASVYYVSNYGKDEGEWNGALNRSNLYATNDVFDYAVDVDSKIADWSKINTIVTDTTGLVKDVDYFTNKPGQIYHNQWSEPDENGQVTLLKNPYRNWGAYIITGYGDRAAYTPNVVAGGKFFPEIMAFSGTQHVHNGGAPVTTPYVSSRYNYKNKNFKFTHYGDLENLTVVEDPENPENSALKFTTYAYAGMSTGNEADFSVVGKENVALANRSVVFEVKVYIHKDWTMWRSDYTQKNQKPFSIQIAKNVDFYKDFLDNTTFDGYLSINNQLDFLHRANVDEEGNPTAQYLDAVTFRAGTVYLGSYSKGIPVCPYIAGRWYTIRYYLDTTGDVPVHAVEVLDGTDHIEYKKANVRLGEYGTFGYYANDSAEVIAERQSLYLPFDGFGEDDTYHIFVRTDAKESEPTVERDFIGYVDDISLKSTGVMCNLYGEIESSKDAVKAYVNRTDGEEQIVNAKLIAAEYDKTTKALIQAKAVDVSVAASKEFKEFSIKFDNEIKEGNTVKLFFWDSLDNISNVTASLIVE